MRIEIEYSGQFEDLDCKRRAEVEVARDDLNIHELLDLIRSVVIAAGYCKETVDEGILEMADSIREEGKGDPDLSQ